MVVLRWRGDNAYAKPRYRLSPGMQERVQATVTATCRPDVMTCSREDVLETSTLHGHYRGLHCLMPYYPGGRWLGLVV